MPNFVLKNCLRGYNFWGKFIPKITILVILVAVSPLFKSHNGEFWHAGVDLGLPPPHQIL